MSVIGRSLPPGFIAQRCAGDPIGAAVTQALAGAEPGTMMVADDTRHCRLALVLTPDPPISDAAMLDLAGRAVHGALAAVAPPGIPIAVTPPDVLVNGAAAGTLTVRRAGAADWLVLGIDIAVAGEAGDPDTPDPGETPDRTCLAEEGFGDSAPELVASICRHLLSGFDRWAAP